MAGRFPRDVPVLDHGEWSVEVRRSLYEFLRSMFDSVKVMNRVPQDPTEIQAGVSADPGTTSGITTVALEDHVHAIDTTGTPAVVGTTSAQGTGSGLARTNHSHRLGILSAKGDILGHDGSNPVAVPIGADGRVATADSADANGWSWQDQVAYLESWHVHDTVMATDLDEEPYTVAYTCPSGRRAEVLSIVVTNTDVAAREFDLFLGMGMISDIQESLDAGKSKVFQGPFLLNGGDRIQCYGYTTGVVSVSVFAVEYEDPATSVSFEASGALATTAAGPPYSEIYECPSGTKAKVSLVTITNLSAADAHTFNVYVEFDSGAVLISDTDQAIAANETVTLTVPFVLAEGDIVSAHSDDDTEVYVSVYAYQYPADPLMTTEAVTWAEIVGCAVDAPNTLRKTEPTVGWNAGAVSTRAILSGDGYVEFHFNVQQGMCGLSNGNASVSYTDIEFGLTHSLGTHLWSVFESGAFVASFAGYPSSAVARISVVDGVVRYYLDGVLIFTSSATPSYPLLVDSSLTGAAAEVVGATLAGYTLGASGY